eukprot:gene10303-biopygen4972
MTAFTGPGITCTVAIAVADPPVDRAAVNEMITDVQVIPVPPEPDDEEPSITKSTHPPILEGWTEGDIDGVTVGFTERIGDTDGITVGCAEGVTEGLTDGDTDGITVGCEEGVTDGLTDGDTDGITVGCTEGVSEGLTDGEAEGDVGTEVGIVLG